MAISASSIAHQTYISLPLQAQISHQACISLLSNLNFSSQAASPPFAPEPCTSNFPRITANVIFPSEQSFSPSSLRSSALPAKPQFSHGSGSTRSLAASAAQSGTCSSVVPSRPLLFLPTLLYLSPRGRRELWLGTGSARELRPGWRRPWGSPGGRGGGTARMALSGGEFVKPKISPWCFSSCCRSRPRALQIEHARSRLSSPTARLLLLLRRRSARREGAVAGSPDGRPRGDGGQGRMRLGSAAACLDCWKAGHAMGGNEILCHSCVYVRGTSRNIPWQATHREHRPAHGPMMQPNQSQREEGKRRETGRNGARLTEKGRQNKENGAKS